MLKTGIFANRWWMVLGAVLGLIFNTGVVANFTLSVFLKPVTTDLGISRTTLTFAHGVIGATFGTLMTPLFGKALDYFGLRRVHLPMIAAFAAATAMLSLLQPALWVLALLYLLHHATGPGQSPVAYSKAIAAAFDKERGLALGIAIAGVGLGVALIPQYANFLIRHVGWRGAYVGIGLAMLVVALLPAILFEREPASGSERLRWRGGGAGEALEGVSLQEAALGSWRFWAMTAAFFLTIVAVNGTLINVVALLTDRGLPRQEAVNAISFSGVALVVGRIGSGFCLDRLHGPYVAALFIASAGLGVALLAGGTAPVTGTILCGLGIGAEVDLMAFFVSRYFGLRAFGAIYGLMFALFGLGVGLGPFLMSVSHDYAGSYVPMMLAFEAGLAAAILLLLPLGRYRFAAPAAAQ